VRSRKRTLLLSVAVLIGLAGTTLGTTAASAAGSSAAVAGWDIFDNPSSLCVGINAQSQAGIWKCTGNPDQTWHWGAGSGGYNQLINGNGQCLGVAGGSTAVGARLVGWTCNGHPDQYWAEAVPVCNYVWMWAVVNKNSHQVMGVQGGNEENGAPVVQWNFQNTFNNQYWGIGQIEACLPGP
jgi:ricin-type beta-trefoil lectin protein